MKFKLDENLPVSSAAILTSTGHDVDTVTFLGHSEIAVTMEIYTEVPSAATGEALGKLGQWLDSGS